MGASVLVTKHETPDLAVKVVGFIDENDHLVLLGYDSDEYYEWGVTVDKEQKEALLLSFVKKSFQSDVTFRTFCAWLEETGIPYRLSETTDLEPSGP